MTNTATQVLLLFLLATSIHAEPIEKPYEIDNVLVTFFWFDSLAELQIYFDEERIEGMSECELYEDKNIAHCDVYAVRPKDVDDEYTLTIGHEVLHGVYGDKYHKEVE